MTSTTKAAPGSDRADTVLLGVEEEFHVVDLATRELVARAPDVLRRLPSESFDAELQGSTVESRSEVRETLDDLRVAVLARRAEGVAAAEAEGLGLVAAGTVPLVDPLRLAVTATPRYERMLEDYQLLVREQLICGAHVHVQLSDRDVAVAVAQRVTPYLPPLLALSASSPFWLGEDSGYASYRSLVWQRWPTAGFSEEVASAAAHDQLVADLVASGVIADPGMVYFDVRPSLHVPTVELRVPDACPDVDTIVLLAGLFRALVRREREAVLGGRPPLRRSAPLLRAAMWRAARSGLEGELVDLSGAAPRPVPAKDAVFALLDGLRPQLESTGDWHQVETLARTAVTWGTSAAQQRRAYRHRSRLSDVVDLLVVRTRAGDRPTALAPPFSGALSRPYALAGDEVFGGDSPPAPYQGLLRRLDELGAPGLRARETVRDDEQRARGMTFGVAGGVSTRLFPVDLVPRIVTGEDWAHLTAGLEQRVRALDAFLHDVYSERAIVADGVLPAALVNGAPGLASTGALLSHQRVRAHVSGMDLVRDSDGSWFVLEDNLRVPSGLAYAVQNRRLTGLALPDLPRPPRLLDVAGVSRMLHETLLAAALPQAGDEPRVVLLSEGPEGSAWFEHRLLAAEMGVPVATTGELVVLDRRVALLRDGVLTPVDVLYLRIGEETLLHALDASGQPLGPPLLSAVAAGGVALANGLGNGVADDKAVYAHVPAMIRYYLGEEPALASVPTYLCSDPEQREAVLGRLDELVLKPVDGYGGEGILIGPRANEEDLAATRRQVVAAPHRWIAQELVKLSTHPSFDGEGLVPRHVDLRAFVFLSDRPRVAPVALTRVAPAGSMVVNSSRGGGSKDTWILGGAP